ncbi:MAG: Asp-tRNA(Asn)/Glu-tRNA(Gln) amidotransferase subunit GatA [Actinomycetota bacterium]
MDLNYLCAHQLNKLLKNKEIKSVDILESIAGRIDEVDKNLNCYITKTLERAEQQARHCDKMISDGKEIGALAGIPIGLKDNICTKGIKTTCSSRLLRDFEPVYDATVVRNLENQNYVLTGKLNMDEFAMGSSSENCFFGPAVKNPWDTGRVAGGSSGGPAAAVAAGDAVCSLGSDTGGSIRLPASFCGIVGMKPTYGRVSRYGLVAFASSLDQIGPLTRDVRDAAAMLNVICGHDRLDSTSIPEPVPDYTKYLVDDVKGLKVGVIEELTLEGIDSDEKRGVDKCVALLKDMGAEIETVSLPSLKYALSVYYILSASEASANLARFDGVRYGWRDKEAKSLREMYRKTRTRGFGVEVKRRIMIGTYCLSAGHYGAYYEKARKVRTLIIKEFNDAFSKFDVLISPTSPTVAFKLGERTKDPWRMYMSDKCASPANLAGLPAISIPVGLSDEGLPIGFQIMGDILREDNVIRTAYSLEKALDFRQRPKL